MPRIQHDQKSPTDLARNGQISAKALAFSQIGDSNVSAADSIFIEAVSLHDGQKLVAKQPLEFRFKDGHDFIVVENDTLGISVYPDRIEEASSAIRSQIDFLWTEYVVDDTDPLSTEAQRLKAKLQSVFRVV